MTMLGETVRISWRRLAALGAGIAFAGVALAADAPPLAVLPAAPAVPTHTVTAPPATPAPPQPGSQPGLARLEQLVAPIALYPDPLLAQILMATTYPLEVVEAARWIADPAHRALSGEALAAAVAAQNWDPSVKALVAFPEVLANMSEKLQWTHDLGNAVVAGQGEVMDAVQHLRRQALAAGHFAATPQCDCKVEPGAAGVAIPPAEPEQIRVPVYGPAAYGPWPEPAYPPDSFPIPSDFDFPPGSGIGFEPPVDLALFGPLWGWSWIDWGSRVIVVSPRRPAVIAGRRAALAGRVWVHDPAHRGGVRYADAAARTRFEAARVAALTLAAARTRLDVVRVSPSAATARAAATPDPAIAPHFDRAGGFVALRREPAPGGGASPATTTVLRGRTAFDREAALVRSPPARREMGGTDSRTAPVSRAAPAFHAGPKFSGGGSHAGAGSRTGGTGGQTR
jgi:hypothetical protein